jgi:hypothetical protein
VAGGAVALPEEERPGEEIKQWLVDVKKKSELESLRPILDRF